jgi:hypothetical protein
MAVWRRFDRGLGVTARKRAALASAAVEAAFAGDWTRRNPKIPRLLEKHGRSGVPFYLLQDGGDAPPCCRRSSRRPRCSPLSSAFPRRQQRAFLPTTGKE